MGKINEIRCASILSKSNLPDCDYVINPYVGCLHNCSYCYARFMKKYSGHDEDWGTFLDAKINAPEVLERELSKNSKRGSIFISSVTDPYQQLEKEYKLTRKVLEVLSKYDYPVSILTKSKLVLRDLDLLKKIKNSEVGFSICVSDDAIRAKMEPGTSSVAERVDALQMLHNSGIKTYAFIGPIIPYVTKLEEVFELINGKVDFIYAEVVNIKCGNWEALYNSVKDVIGIDEAKFKSTIQSPQIWDRAEEKVKDLCERYNIKLIGFFRH